MDVKIFFKTIAVVLKHENTYKDTNSEANQQSGTMITVGHGLEQGKDIYCVPSRINDALGCNYLIQQGAKLVINVSDILNG